MAGTFLTAEWRKLIMAQYVVKPDLLKNYLPHGLELDLFAEHCYVSLVAFQFDQVRLRGLPVPFHTSFEEINLRFYVRRRMPDGVLRRGVVFVREFVPRRAIAYVAKHFYDEPYLALPTRRSLAQSPQSLDVSYDWRLGGRWHSLSVKALPESQPIAQGSEEEFLTEHYWGYTKRRDGSTSEYEVKHPRWRTYPLKASEIRADFGALYGNAFAHLNDEDAASVLIAEGSAVSVHEGQNLSL